MSKGLFVSVDGPGGVGKSTMIAAVADALAREGVRVCVTTEPTRTPLGDLLRHGTDTYHGAALALLVAGDRQHHIATEIQPALARGQVVISDRYVASSLVLQRLDGLDFAYVWQLNADMLRPDLAIILNGDPAVIASRLAARGGHSRFERQPGSAHNEALLYTDTAARLKALGWPLCELDATSHTPDQLAALVCSQISNHPSRGDRGYRSQPGACMTSLSLLTLNIANPSVERAERQLAWLAERPEDVLVLTETKASQGCALLADMFRTAGYAVFDSRPAPGEYGVMIVSKVQAQPDDFTDRVGYLSARAAACWLATDPAPIRLIGTYVPSRDASPEKIERKQRWLAAFDQALDTSHDRPMLLLGDLNVLEPDHQPAYRFFASFEYDFYRGLSSRHGMVDAFRHRHGDLVQHSWVGRTGDGYRYDHAFCSASLRDRIGECTYEHQVRLDRLSDHSAMTLSLGIVPPRRLDVSDPTMATQEATLF